MKNIFFLILSLISFASFAGVITCSNNSNSPGQYSNLQAAIDDASTNDTILVAGSPTHYGTVTINSKALTIIGAGVNNPNGYDTEINYLNLERVSSSLSASGSSIIGVKVLNTLLINPSNGSTNYLISDILIERCHIGSIQTQDGASFEYANLIIKNNILGVVGMAQASLISNVKILNNIFSTGSVRQSGYSDNSGILVANNIFLWNDQFSFYTNAAPTSNPGMTVNNNIFYYSEPSTLCYNCSFSNNITYFNSDDNIIGAGNPGSTGGANLIGQDPLFVNYPVAGASFDYTYDFHLKSGSPAIDAGTDGTDIGIYGGVAPFTDAADVGANPAIPQMQEITTPLGSTVSKGTNLNVTLKSYKQD